MFQLGNRIKRLYEKAEYKYSTLVYEFLTDEWCGSQDNSDTEFKMKIEDIR